MLLGQGVANVAKSAQSAKTIGKGVVNTVRSLFMICMDGCSSVPY
jgi:hypothetical protein